MDDNGKEVSPNVDAALVEGKAAEAQEQVSPTIQTEGKPRTTVKDEASEASDSYMDAMKRTTHEGPIEVFSRSLPEGFDVAATKATFNAGGSLLARLIGAILGKFGKKEGSEGGEKQAGPISEPSPNLQAPAAEAA